MNNFTKEQIIEVLKAKSYKIFNDHNPNIVGVRSLNRSGGKYDDKIFVFWKDGIEEVFHHYTATTDPGLTYLNNPIAGTKGTAILVPGQYAGCWKLGLHRGKQDALVQTGNKVKVYRDNNKDGVLDTNPDTIQEGWFGINGHHGAQNDGDIINGWSAGCQVWRYHTPHQLLIKKLKKLASTYSIDSFTYTLLQESDFQ